jgi:aspartyl-tRNA(Asn)/glutamyl-tRNA(Gln) amidotransferase subunit B
LLATRLRSLTTKAGKEKAFNSMVGQVMKATRGKANPAQVNLVLKRKLSD